MIRVRFTPQCQSLLDTGRLPADLAIATVNARQRIAGDSKGTRFVACRWLCDDRIILVDSEVTALGADPADARNRIEEVTAQVALALRPQMPAGPIDRGADAETILAVAAESFGYPLTCDANEPFSTLYSGPGSRQTVVVHSGCIPAEYWLIGSFDAASGHSELVWAFRPDRYWKWRALAE